MKKCLSLILMIAFILSTLSLSVSAADQKLPELNPPAHIALVHLNDSDSPTMHGFAYSIDSELVSFVDALNAAENNGAAEEFLAPFGLSDLFYTVQIDWALDDVKNKVSGWHYNAYWTYNDAFAGFGIDNEGHLRVSEWDHVDVGLVGGELIHTVRIFRNVPNDTRWNGDSETKMPGVKSQLRPSQYTYQDETLRIDLKKHTFYVRARIVCVGKKIGEQQYKVISASTWSQTASSGKSTKAPEPLTEDDITAPKINDLHISEKTFNGIPVAAYNLTVPDDLIQVSTQIAAADGAVQLETQARVTGDESWTDISDADRELRPGERFCPLSALTRPDRPMIRADAPIELRCRYRCSLPGQDDILSDWSAVISCGSLPPAATPDEATVDETPAGEQTHHPYLFVGIACAAAISAAVVFIVIRHRKKQHKS